MSSAPIKAIAVIGAAMFAMAAHADSIDEAISKNDVKASQESQGVADLVSLEKSRAAAERERVSYAEKQVPVLIEFSGDTKAYTAKFRLSDGAIVSASSINPVIKKWRIIGVSGYLLTLRFKGDKKTDVTVSPQAEAETPSVTGLSGYATQTAVIIPPKPPAGH